MNKVKLLFIIIWMVVIFLFSNQPASKSGELSDGLIISKVIDTKEVTDAN